MFSKKLVSREDKEIKTYIPKSPPGVHGGPLRRAWVYRFWPPMLSTGREGIRKGLTTLSVNSPALNFLKEPRRFLAQVSLELTKLGLNQQSSAQNC